MTKKIFIAHNILDN